MCKYFFEEEKNIVSYCIRKIGDTPSIKIFIGDVDNNSRNPVNKTDQGTIGSR